MLFVGRLDANKNVSLLIKSYIQLCSLCKNIHLNIIGSGEFELAFKDIDKLWGKITFYGKLNKENVYKLYQISNIGIIPSLYEELGYVAIEMMMHRIPIIASNNEGLQEIMTDKENGLLFTPTDADSLFQKIQCLIEDKSGSMLI